MNTKRLAYVVREADEAFETPLEDAAAGAGGRAAVDRKAIAGAVERYLAARGVPTGNGGEVAGRGAASAAEEAVDRFLARRGGAASSIPGAPGSCAACAATPEADGPANAAPEAVPIEDFVCEQDVREAIRQNRKIFIGPRTIVTPSARDLGAAGDILVLAQR
jgi:hypothetical protein